MINVLVTGVDEGITRLTAMADACEDFTELWPEVDAIIRDDTSDVFETGGGMSPYAPLAESTLRKARRSPLPFDTTSRNMWDSFTQESSPDHIYDVIGKTRAKFGSANPVAVYHYFGTVKMPARPPWNNLQLTLQRIGKAFTAFLEGRLNGRNR